MRVHRCKRDAAGRPFWRYVPGSLLVLLVAAQSHAALLAMTDMSLTPDPALNPTPNLITQPALLTSYTTSAGTVTDLSHAASASGRFDIPSGSAPNEVRNFWGDEGAEIDGAVAAMNFDVSTGVLNAGDSNDSSFIDLGSTGSNRAHFFFSEEISQGVPGDGNDFFLIEVGTGEFISVAPLDATGNEIGDALLIQIAEWGVLTPDVLIDGDGGVNNLTFDLAGVAFDYEDFTNLTGPIAGIGLRGAAGVDASVVGVNSNLASLPVPEPGTLVLACVAGLMGFGCLRRR